MTPETGPVSRVNRLARKPGAPGAGRARHTRRLRPLVWVGSAVVGLGCTVMLGWMALAIYFDLAPLGPSWLRAGLGALVPAGAVVALWLVRPLRWLMTETARAFHKARGRRGHFWERRYRSCLVEEDTYVLAALRYLDRNAVRAGLVTDPTTYQWSSCAAYALGTPNRVITLHPSYLALSPYAKVRQRQYRTLLAPSQDPQADARDARWTTQRAVGSPTFMAPYVSRRGRRRIGTRLTQDQEFKP